MLYKRGESRATFWWGYANRRFGIDSAVSRFGLSRYYAVCLENLCNVTSVNGRPMSGI
jgi:hypothetical protein